MARPASSLQRQGTALLTWVDKRLPVVDFWNAHLAHSSAPVTDNSLRVSVNGGD